MNKFWRFGGQSSKKWNNGNLMEKNFQFCYSEEIFFFWIPVLYLCAMQYFSAMTDVQTFVGYCRNKIPLHELIRPAIRWNEK